MVLLEHTVTGLSMEKVCDNDLQWGNYSHHSFSLTPPSPIPTISKPCLNISLSTDSSPFPLLLPWTKAPSVSHLNSINYIYYIYILCSWHLFFITAPRVIFKNINIPIIPCLKASSGTLLLFVLTRDTGLLTPWNVLLCTHDFSSVKSQQPSHPRKPSLTTLSEVACQVLAITSQSLTFCITELTWILQSSLLVYFHVWVFHLKLTLKAQ